MVDSGPASFYVDRRMLSIETKRALSVYPGWSSVAFVTEVRLATPRVLSRAMMENRAHMTGNIAHAGRRNGLRGDD